MSETPAGSLRRGASAVAGPVEVGVIAQPVAVPADAHDVTVVNKPVNQYRGHDVMPEDLPPSSKPLLEVSTGEARS